MCRRLEGTGVVAITLPPARDDERQWLFALHEAALRERVEIVYGLWDAVWQWNAFNNERHPDNRVEIIEADGAPVGALHTRVEGDLSLYIDLLEILPQYQSRGIGTDVLSSLCASTAMRGQDTTLRVHTGSPAQRLYERLGFVVEAETDTHLLMRHAGDVER